PDPVRQVLATTQLHRPLATTVVRIGKLFFGRSLSHNISFLQELTTALKRFVDSKGNDFSMFGENKDVLAQAYANMVCEIPELRGAL
ncbi:MAG: hypothetical protein SGJ19_06470, partial [Planctomycetia bacterium]|nr:hypothetical protein [Planctomycetia bacterium]